MLGMARIARIVVPGLPQHTRIKYGVAGIRILKYCVPGIRIPCIEPVGPKTDHIGFFCKRSGFRHVTDVRIFVM